MTHVRKILNLDCRSFVRLLVHTSNFPKSTVHETVINNLQMRKLWVEMVSKVFKNSKKPCVTARFNIPTNNQQIAGKVFTADLFYTKLDVLTIVLRFTWKTKTSFMKKPVLTLRMVGGNWLTARSKVNLLLNPI